MSPLNKNTCKIVDHKCQHISRFTGTKYTAARTASPAMMSCDLLLKGKLILPLDWLKTNESLVRARYHRVLPAHTGKLNFPGERNLIINAHLASNLLIFRFIEKTVDCRLVTSWIVRWMKKVNRAVLGGWKQQETKANKLAEVAELRKFTENFNAGRLARQPTKQSRFIKNHSLNMKNILLRTRVPSHAIFFMTFFHSLHFNWIKWRIFIRGASWSNL